MEETACVIELLKTLGLPEEPDYIVKATIVLKELERSADWDSYPIKNSEYLEYFKTKLPVLLKSTEISSRKAEIESSDGDQS